MTKQEFIESYLTASDALQYRTADGFTCDGIVQVAVPCECGEDLCEGWAMEFQATSKGGSEHNI